MLLSSSGWEIHAQMGVQCSLTYKNILYKNIVRRFGEKNEDAFRQLFLKSMYASGEGGGIQHWIFTFSDNFNNLMLYVSLHPNHVSPYNFFGASHKHSNSRSSAFCSLSETSQLFNTIL